VPAGRTTRIDRIESLRLEKLHSGLSLVAPLLMLCPSKIVNG
jgi:hypothetical protein